MSLQTRLSSLITVLGADFKLKTVPIVFSVPGALTTRTGVLKVQMLGSGTLVAVKGWLQTPATGGTTFKVDVNKNDVTIYTTQGNRPTWVASANAATVLAHQVTTFVDNDRLSLDIDAVGNTVAGSDLTVTVYILRTA